MITLATFSNQEVLPYIGSGLPPKSYTTNDGTFRIKMNGARLECLKRSQTCVWFYPRPEQVEPTSDQLSLSTSDAAE